METLTGKEDIRVGQVIVGINGEPYTIIPVKRMILNPNDESVKLDEETYTDILHKAIIELQNMLL